MIFLYDAENPYQKLQIFFLEEEKVATYATQYPEVIYFCGNITTDN